MKVRRKKDIASVHLGHYSMEHGDTPRQITHDLELMMHRDYDWITGTEAGVGQDVLPALRIAAMNFGYHFHSYKSNWVMVKKTLVVPKTLVPFSETVIDNDVVVGRGHDTNVVALSFENPFLGDVTVMCSHYPTMGQPDRKPNPNLKHNKTLAARIGELADEFGRGRALFFYGGDQNIGDALNDTFFGEDLTSVQDEVGRWENTGHGPIDVIASYDKDKRVDAVDFEVITDREVFHFTDHFPLEADYTVKLLPSALA